MPLQLLCKRKTEKSVFWKLELHDKFGGWKKAVQIITGTGKELQLATVQDPTGKYDGNGVNRTLYKNPRCILKKQPRRDIKQHDY